MTSGETTDAAVKSTASELVEDGRAKVNLTLRVVGRRVDGYHDLESVVAFADCADQLSLLPGSELELNTTGPLAEACGEVNDNLVFKAARLLAERVPDLKTGDVHALQDACRRGRNRRRFGGCRSRAAAACEGQWSRSSTMRACSEVAQLTGADVPVCVASRACVMTGVGESLLPLALPKLALRAGQSARGGGDQGRVRGAGPAQR